MGLHHSLPSFSPLRRAVTQAGYIAMGFLVLLFFLVLLRDLFGVVAASLQWIALKTNGAFPSAPLTHLHSFLFSPRSGPWMLLLTFLLTSEGYWTARRAPHVVETRIPVAGLAAEFEGYRIVQISDMHFGACAWKREALRTARMVNELKPDLVAFTGDVADGPANALREVVEPLGKIQATDGLFFVTGNHEYYWDPPGWIRLMKDLGYRVLMNENVILKRGKARGVLGGVPDPASRNIALMEPPDVKKALAGSPEGSFRILLAHQPKTVREAALEKVDLVLSGHTHAGQFIPFNVLTGWVEPFLAGLYEVGATHVYVNRGTSYWGPPIRLGIPSEITLITLHRE